MTSVAAPSRPPGLPASWVRSADGRLHRDPPVEALRTARETPGSTIWVDIDPGDPAQLALLSSLFGFHPLAIEDTQNPNSRVKLDEYEGVLFLIMRGVAFEHRTEDPLDLVTFNLCCFLAPGLLVTTHTHPIPAIEAFHARCAAGGDALARGPAHAMYHIVEGAVDAYFPVLDELNEFVDDLEDRLFTRSEDGVMAELFAVKRTVLTLRRHLAPQREVFHALANRPHVLLSVEEQRYFRDVYDHVLRITETLEQYRDLLTTVLDAALNQTSVRLGQVTKGLTVVATVSVPFVVVSGMWGMNFARVPLSDAPGGFWAMLLLQLGLGLGLYWFLRRRGWL